MDERKFQLLLTYARRVCRSTVLAGAAVTVLVAGCGTEAPESPPARRDPGLSESESASPLPPTFYVDPANPASGQAARWETDGLAGDAEELRKISERPSAKWMTGEQVSVRDEVAAFVSQAAIAGQTPVLVVHNVPDRDCGRFDTGGAPTGEAYQSWIRDLAAGISGRPVTVILEPNAVADAIDGCARDSGERLVLLRDAIAVLKSTGTARVYLDAGHPSWIKDIKKLAGTLQQAGIGDADGFALNVANFIGTEENVRYGHRISDALGGETPFVIDTSRNGNGPFPGDTTGGGPSWCNPPGRALGAEPTADPKLARVDALLWIKYPGESDGACRPGEPETGIWWPEYALDLARRSA